MTTPLAQQLLQIADRESFGPMARLYEGLRERCELALRLDLVELQFVFSHLGGSPVVPALMAQGENLTTQGQQLLRQLELRFQKLHAVQGTPARTAAMGRAWMEEVETLDEMIASAEKLLDMPGWKGTAAEAHLAVVREQVAAMHSLRSQAVTAGESVIAVGVLQTAIFDACSLLLGRDAMSVDVEPPSGFVPDTLYRRTVGVIGILTRAVIGLDAEITGETWGAAARALADELAEASPAEDFRWPRALRDSEGGGREAEVEGDASVTPPVTTQPSEDEVGTGEPAVVDPETDTHLVDPEGPADAAADVPSGTPADETSEPGAPVDSDPVTDPAPEPDPAPGDPAPEPEPVTRPGAAVPPPPAPAPTPVSPTPAPVPPAPAPEPVPAVPVFAEAEPVVPVEPIAAEEAWEQIARERALAEEALFPRPVPVAPIEGLNRSPGVAQQLR